MGMLRPLVRSSAFAAKGMRSVAAKAAGARRSVFLDAEPYGSSKMPTQSSDDVVKPTAQARLYLEDGTTLLAKSFGCHKSVEGEVRKSESREGFQNESITRLVSSLSSFTQSRSSLRLVWSDTPSP